MFYIKDGSDPDGVKRILDMKYMKLLRTSMRVVGAWPSKAVGDLPTKWDKPASYILTSTNIAVTMMHAIYIKQSFRHISFFDKGHSYITCFMNGVALTRTLIIFQKSYHEISEDFMTKVHLFNIKDNSDYSMQVHRMIHKLSHFFTIYVVMLMSFGLVLFNATAIYHNVTKGSYIDAVKGDRNVTLEHAITFYLPYDTTSKLMGYFSVFALNWYLSVTCSICFCCYDLFVSLFVFHVWGNLKILIYNLENFPRPSQVKNSLNDNSIMTQAAMFSKEEREQVFLRLRELVNHHRTILNFIAKISETFGTMLFIYYGFHQISGCILLLECSTLEPDALIRYGPLTMIIFQELIQVSLVFELLSSTTESLINAVYSLPWEYMDVGNRKIVQIMLRQAQIPLSTKASGMLDVGSGTMVTMRGQNLIAQQSLSNLMRNEVKILKTSISYFIMLRTFASEDS